MKFCVLVCYDENYKKMASITVDLNIAKYCEMHGYDLHKDYQEFFTDGRPAQWRKIKAARELLETNKYDWIFFIDVDCIIMNPDIKLESFIDDTYSFLLPSQDIKAPDTPILKGDIHNIITSQFFVKNDEFGREILDKIWIAENNSIVNEFDHEGRQVRILINEGKYNKHINIIDGKRLNRFWYANNPFMVFAFKGFNENAWQEGDFIVLVTTYSTEERVRLLSDLNYFSGLNNKNEIS